MRVDLSNGQYQRLVATLDGDLGISVGKDGVQQVLADLNIKDGSMLVAGYDRIDVPSGQLKSVMRDSKVELEQLALNLGSAGRFDLDGVLEISDACRKQIKFCFDQNATGAAADLKCARHGCTTVCGIVAKLDSAKTRDWVGKNIPQGGVRASSYHLLLIWVRLKGCKKFMMQKGMSKFETHLRWSENADMMTNVDADLYWNNDKFTARFLTGNVGDVFLQRGRVFIFSVLSRVEKDALVSLTARGGMETRFILRVKLDCQNMVALISIRLRLTAKLNSP